MIGDPSGDSPSQRVQLGVDPILPQTRHGVPQRLTAHPDYDRPAFESRGQLADERQPLRTPCREDSRLVLIADRPRYVSGPASVPGVEHRAELVVLLEDV